MKATLADWNKRPDFQDELNDFLNSPAGIAMVEVLTGLAPAVARTRQLDGISASFELGFSNGYLCYNTYLQSMRKEIPEAQEEPKANFAEENNE